jgi:hypothetical protein
VLVKGSCSSSSRYHSQDAADGSSSSISSSWQSGRNGSLGGEEGNFGDVIEGLGPISAYNPAGVGRRSDSGMQPCTSWWHQNCCALGCSASAPVRTRSGTAVLVLGWRHCVLHRVAAHAARVDITACLVSGLSDSPRPACATCHVLLPCSTSEVLVVRRLSTQPQSQQQGVSASCSCCRTET